MPRVSREIHRKIKREAGLLGMPHMWRVGQIQLLGEKERHIE